MIRRLVPAAAVALALLAAGCGSGDEAEPLDPDKLTIYSAQHDNLVDAWVKGFTAETGVEVMRMSLGLDEGPVLLSARVPITAEDTAGSLHDKLAEAGAPGGP